MAEVRIDAAVPGATDVPDDPPPDRRGWPGAPWAMAVCALAVYLVGAGRAFDYDGAVTMEEFVFVPSWTTAFDHQDVSNNHPFFSFLEHVLWRASDSSQEWTMRLLPAVFAAVAVGLVGHAARKRWGLGPGIVAGAVLALLPMTMSAAREPRGYSLVLLCAIGSTLLLIRDRPGWRYAALVAVGIATHTSMGMVLVLQFAWVAHRRALPSWRVWMLGSAVAGSSAYLFMLDEMAYGRGRRFQASFPLELVRELLGNETVTVAVLGICVAVALTRFRSPLMATLGVVLVAGPWLVGPLDWYPRFYTWAVPTVALGAAWCVHRARFAAVPVLVGLAACLAASFPTTGPGMANRAAADLPPGGCLGGWSSEAAAVYAPANTRRVGETESLRGCTALLIVMPDAHPQLVAQAKDVFGPPRVLPAATHGLLFS